ADLPAHGPSFEAVRSLGTQRPPSPQRIHLFLRALRALRSTSEIHMDDKRALLRHAVATVAYRGGKAVRGAPAAFASFSGDASDRTAVKILAHISDLYDWALTQASGAEAWHDS